MPAGDEKDHCLRCVPCDIMRGFGGAGAFSDGKYNFTTEFGGWLNEYLPHNEVIDLIDYVDELNCRHGAPGEYFSTKNCTIGAKALGYDLHLLNAKVRHLGTENNLIIMENIYKYLLEHGITIEWKALSAMATALFCRYAARAKWSANI